MRPLFAKVAGSVAALAVCFATFTAAAQPSDEAKESFDKGKTLFEQKKYEDALPALQRATELTDSPNARLYVGRCLKELGRRAEAYEELRMAMSDAAKLADSDPKYAKTRDAAAAQVAILDREVGKVVVVVTEQRKGVVAKLAGRTLLGTELGVPRAVEPGAVVVQLEVDGKVVSEKTVDVGAGATVSVTLAPDGAAETKTGPTDPDPKTGPKTEPKTSGGGVRIAGFVVGGLGVGGLIGFGVAGGLALGKKGELDDACGDGACPDDSHQDTIDEGRTLSLAANVCLGVGAGLLTAGVFMIAFGGPTEEEPPKAAIIWDGTGVRAVVPF